MDEVSADPPVVRGDKLAVFGDLTPELVLEGQLVVQRDDPGDVEAAHELQGDLPASAGGFGPDDLALAGVDDAVAQPQLDVDGLAGLRAPSSVGTCGDAVHREVVDLARLTVDEQHGPHAPSHSRALYRSERKKRVRPAPPLRCS